MKRVLIVSLLVNAGLLIALFWRHSVHREELLDFMGVAARADETHLYLYSMALAAFESGEPAEQEEVALRLRPFIEAATRNKEARDELRAKGLLR